MTDDLRDRLARTITLAHLHLIPDVIGRGLIRDAGYVAADAVLAEVDQERVAATYCPVHGDLLAGIRSARCAETEPGHELLAVVDPDGLRAAVESERERLIRYERVLDADIAGAEAERDAAVREAAALREQVESLTEQVQTRRRYERLHAIKHHGARPLTDAERATYPDGYDPLANFPAARNPEAEALRAGVEAVIPLIQAGMQYSAVQNLRALLADPTPDGRMFVAAPDVEAGDNLPGSWTPQHRAPEAEQ